VQAQEVSDSAQAKSPLFISAQANKGVVLPTNDFVKNEGISSFSAFSLKFCVASKGTSWQDFAYGLPYFGVGLYTANFGDTRLGNPLSLFLLQGARIFGNHSFSFNYEFHLGYSTNWNHYDRFENPHNIAIGSKENIHAAANVYFSFQPLRRLNMNIGCGFNHFSNGAMRLPNKGMNLVSPFVELRYVINPLQHSPENTKQAFSRPPLEKRIDHDFALTVSSRQITFSRYNTGLGSEYVDYNFRVLGASYAPLFVNHFAFKWGPSVEIVYDESGGASARRELLESDGKYYDRVYLGSVRERIDAGISAKGEAVMPHFSIFANFGCEILLGNPNNKRLYQIIGVKLPSANGFFGSFAIRAHRFGKAQFIMWSVGYTLPTQWSTIK
jgi:hypothetical protein